MERVAVFLLIALALASLSSSGTQSTLPVGWERKGSLPQYYRVTLDDKNAPSGDLCAVLSSRFGVPSRGNTLLGAGTLIQAIHAEQYHNKRIEISASVRIEDVR